MNIPINAIVFFVGLFLGIVIVLLWPKHLIHYPFTLQTIKKKLNEEYPEYTACEGDVNDVEHTLWMIDQVPTYREQGKIDRWIGWIAGKAHSKGVLTRQEAHDIVHNERIHFNSSP